MQLGDGVISLSRAVLADASELAQAGARFFSDTFGAANRAEDLESYVSTAFSVARQRAELSDANSRIWLARNRTGELAGYAHVRLGASVPAGATIISERPAEIARIYADRRWHGQGVGASLMDVCFATAREWGADLLWLGVWERNPRAIAFYEKHGFLIVGEQPFQLGADLQRDLVMAHRLTNAD